MEEYEINEVPNNDLSNLPNDLQNSLSEARDFPNISAITPNESVDMTFELESITEEIVTESEDNLTEVTDNFTRLKGASWFSQAQETNVIVIGAGGIGSWTSFLIKRAGFNKLTIFDNDRVEEVNLAGQMYSYKDIGQYKSNVVANKISEDYSIEGNYIEDNVRFKVRSDIRRMNKECIKNVIASEMYEVSKVIVILAVDNITMRAELLDVYKEHYLNSPNLLIIDGRMEAETFQVMAFSDIVKNNISNVENYIQNYIYDDSEEEPLSCTYKSTSHTACGIAYVITNLCVSWCDNFVLKNSRPVPFRTEFFSPLSQFIVEDEYI